MKGRRTRAAPEPVPTEPDELAIEFQNAGMDIEPISVNSEEEACMEIDSLASVITPGVEWDEQVNALTKAMALVNGGIFEYEGCIKNLIHLYPGLSADVINLRSTLVKTTCLFIAQLARELKYKFDAVGDMISPLSTRVSHGTRVIADSCRYAILEIARNCGTKRTLSSILDLCGARGPAQKAVAAEAVMNVMYTWPAEAFGTNWPRLLGILEKMLSGATVECRMFARQAAKGLKKMSRERFAEFAKKLDIKMKCAIDAEPDIEMQKLTLEDCGIGMKKGDVTAKPLPPRKKPVMPKVEKPQRVSKIRPPTKRKTQLPKKNEVVNVVVEEEEEQNESESVVEEPPAKSYSSDAMDDIMDASVSEEEEIIEQKPKRRVFRLAQAQPASAPRENVLRERVNVDANEPEKKEPVKKEKKAVSRRLTLNPNSVRLVDGKEKAFIQEIRQFTDSGKIKDLRSNIDNIAIDLLKCCIESTSPIAVAALAIIHDLIPVYVDVYREQLPTLLELLLVSSEQGCPRAISNAQIILQDLPNTFEVATLIHLGSQIHPTQALVHFFSSLVDRHDIPFDNSSICFALLDVAFKCYNLGDNRCRHAAAHVIDAVYTMNEIALISWTDELSDSQLNQFEEFIRPYIPEINIRSDDFDIPKYDARNIPLWLNQLEQFSSSITEKEWKTVRPRIYHDLSSALLRGDNFDSILLFIQKKSHETGCGDFNKVLPGILLRAKDPSCKRIAENTLIMFMQNIQTEDLLEALESSIRSTDPVICQNALQYQAQIIASASKYALSPMLPNIIQPLCDLFQNNKPEIRRAVLRCFVELYLTIGSEMDSRTQMLTEAQKKLISVYLCRRNSVAQGNV